MAGFVTQIDQCFARIVPEKRFVFVEPFDQVAPELFALHVPLLDRLTKDKARLVIYDISFLELPHVPLSRQH